MAYTHHRQQPSARLQKEGKLTNVERRAQPIYRPMPGYYGMSRDAELKR